MNFEAVQLVVLACPCCGGPGKLKDGVTPTHGGGYRRGWVGCPECGLYIQWTHDLLGAVLKWNRRAGEVPQQ